MNNTASESCNARLGTTRSESHFSGYDNELKVDGRSFLLVSWKGTEFELSERLRNIGKKLRRLNIGVRLTEFDESHIIVNTVNPLVYSVVFNHHSVAKAAFILQRQLKIEMRIPENSERDWFRPSPGYNVEFE